MLETPDFEIPRSSKRMMSKIFRTGTLATCLALMMVANGVQAGDKLHVIPHVAPAQQTAEYWISRSQQPDALLLSAAQINAQNQRLRTQDPSMHELRRLPAQMSDKEVRARVEKLSARPRRSLYDSQGQRISDSMIDGWLADLALESLPAQVQPRFALVIARADLRTFPTATRVFSRVGDTDIDRFQESALFPGTAVAILHESRDRQWSFVVSARYAAWMRSDLLATGDATTVLAYAERSPWLVVTGARAETVYTPEAPQLSRLSLDMGTRIPLLADWPREEPVNGQLPAAAHVVQLPSRDSEGRLQLRPALLPHSADVSRHYLPLNQRSLLEQSFKFLGERYGWGHSYEARDCSGFVSEVYAGFGLEMPRNTGDQGKSPAFNIIPFTAEMNRDARREVLKTLQVGDLVYIPGHVMMVIGHDKGLTYVIHDTPDVRYADVAGSWPVNGVAVTPLEPLGSDDDTLYIDKIYSVVKMRP
ncbi:NlpC-P60 family protein [Lysobacteraceae bacterium NML95-0200]|nr:NlpC-P60 family protein [Xanthomonadaceae bacterium NML95-0200]